MARTLLILFFCLLPGMAFSAASLEELQQLIDKNNYAAAAQAGTQLLEQSPQQANLMFLTAYAYQMDAQPEKAIVLYERIIRQNPQLPEPRNNLAMIYLDRGDYDRASQLLVDAISSHPSYATAYQNLSRIYKGIASEAYRRAVSETNQPASYVHNIELAAISSIESVAPTPAVDSGKSDTTVVNLANLETLLIEQVKNWAEAWSNKEFPTYIDFYSARHRAKFGNHSAWVEYRRKRITRPGNISVEVGDIRIRFQGDSTAIADFKQAFNSHRYSDRVLKRLVFTRNGSQWKITDERVLSVL